MASSNDVAVSYHSSILYPEDVGLMQPGGWLTDNCLCWYEEFCTHEVFVDKDIAFVHPAAVFMSLFEEPEELRASLAALDLGSKGLVFLPINDNPFAEVAAGGSHWSLLVWNRSGAISATPAVPTVPSGAAGAASSPAVADERVTKAGGCAGTPPPGFSHYDSARGSGNLSVARNVANALTPLLVGGPDTPPISPVVEVVCEQQHNGADCGVHVLLNMHNLAAAMTGMECPPPQISSARTMRTLMLEQVERMQVAAPPVTLENGR